MADEKVFSDGYVDVIVIRQNQLTNPAEPLASEINANGVNVSNALAWDGTTWPNNTDSNDTDDRSVKDAGNATTRGYAQYEATLNFFYPRDLSDTTSDYGKAYQFFKDAQNRVPVYLITRVLQTTAGQIEDVDAGDLVSVFKMGTDAFVTDTEGEDAYKYAINFNTQGGVWPYTQAVGASKSAIAVTLGSGGSAPTIVGNKAAYRAVLNGKRMTNQVRWESSNPVVASVSQNGVVTALTAGSTNITASHPSGTTSTAVALTIA